MQHWQNGNGFSYGPKYLDIGGYTTKTMLGVSENLPPESFKKISDHGTKEGYHNLLQFNEEYNDQPKHGILRYMGA